MIVQDIWLPIKKIRKYFWFFMGKIWMSCFIFYSVKPWLSTCAFLHNIIPEFKRYCINSNQWHTWLWFSLPKEQKRTKTCILEISLTIFCDILGNFSRSHGQVILATNTRSYTFGGKVISASSQRVWASMMAQTTTKKEVGTLTK